MGTVTFLGSVSAQASPGEIVQISVRRADGSIDAMTAVTDEQGIFSADYTAAPGTYSATASIEPDGVYRGATSNSVSFDMQLVDRTITLSVQ